MKERARGSFERRYSVDAMAHGLLQAISDARNGVGQTVSFQAGKEGNLGSELESKHEGLG